MNDVKSRVREILKEEFAIEPASDDQIFYVKGGEPEIVSDGGSALDSLDHVELMMAIEVEFDIEIPDALAPSMVTINAIAANIDTMRQVAGRG